MISFNKVYSEEEFNSFCDCNKKRKLNHNRIFTNLGTYKEFSCLDCNYCLYSGVSDGVLKSIKLFFDDGREIILFRPGILIKNGKTKTYFDTDNVKNLEFKINNLHKRIENLILLI